MQNHLQKAISLAKISGDKIIVFDSPVSDNGYVVMNIDEYEKIMRKNTDNRSLTEQELIDNINRDIAAWKSEQDLSITKNQTEPSYHEEDRGFNNWKIGEKSTPEKKKNKWEMHRKMSTLTGIAR